ncbi:MAG: hypothetical protein ACRDTF_12740 [Pseudonocardiaceae bacterium]
MIINQDGGTGAAAVVDVPVQIPAERCAHLGERPMGYPDQLEPAGQALGQPTLDQQRG